ncbi:hypothetical protein DFH07DRAFT_764865 [Mycena maculata]|uniref:Uncharacterized protein n=1 Tax=Mycena maculata TaxID=230809 RepID=A0AAD7KF33_9AGAR|nr:hypothetical protein DFH07DRAFT_764865 [Mycena maculata]
MVELRYEGGQDKKHLRLLLLPTVDAAADAGGRHYALYVLAKELAGVQLSPSDRMPSTSACNTTKQPLRNPKMDTSPETEDYLDREFLGSIEILPRHSTCMYFTAALSVAEAYGSIGTIIGMHLLGRIRVSSSVQASCCDILVGRTPLSLQTVLFGRNTFSRSLRRMADLAREIQNSAPRDPMQVSIPSSFSAALDTVHLTQAFLDFADSMRKPRGSLLHGHSGFGLISN